MTHASWRGAFAAIFITATAGAADIGQIVEKLSANDREQRRDAAYQLSVLGAQARPALPALLKALDDPDRQVWAYAVTTLGTFGPEAKDAIPKLLESLDSRTSRGFRPRDKTQYLYRSAYTLAQIGDAAKEPLLAALKSDDTGLRLGAAKAFGFMGTKAPEAVPGLIENLGHGDADLRAEAADALAYIGKAAIAPLISSIGWPDPKVRAGSARALGLMGPMAAEAAPLVLSKALEDSEVSVRAEALVASAKIGTPAEKVVPALIAATKAPEADLQRAALDALLLFRPPTAMVPALKALLSDEKYSARAARMLGRLGRSARDAVPTLLALAAKAPSSDASYVDAVVAIGSASVSAVLAEVEKVPAATVQDDHWSLKILGAIGGGAMTEVQKALDSKNASARVVGLRALAQIGPDARGIAARVTALTDDPDPSVRAAALASIVAIDGKVPQVFEPLEGGLADKVPGVRLAASTAAGALGAKARPLAGKVAVLLGDPSVDVQAAAARALGNIGGTGEWTEQLVAKLNDPKLQLVAIESLAKLQLPGVSAKLAALYPKADRTTKLAILAAVGGAGESALPVLESAAQDKDAELRAASLRAMAKNQPNLDTFVPAIVAALADSESIMRVAGANTIIELAPKSPEKFEAVIMPLSKFAQNDADRELALEALRSFRPRSLDAIAQALESPVVEVRLWAIERLGRMGRQARPVKDKLEVLLADQNDYLRRASRRALEQINR